MTLVSGVVWCTRSDAYYIVECVGVLPAECLVHCVVNGQYAVHAMQWRLPGMHLVVISLGLCGTHGHTDDTFEHACVLAVSCRLLVAVHALVEIKPERVSG